MLKYIFHCIHFPYLDILNLENHNIKILLYFGRLIDIHVFKMIINTNYLEHKIIIGKKMKYKDMIMNTNSMIKHFRLNHLYHSANMAFKLSKILNKNNLNS